MSTASVISTASLVSAALVGGALVVILLGLEAHPDNLKHGRKDAHAHVHGIKENVERLGESTIKEDSGSHKVSPVLLPKLEKTTPNNGSEKGNGKE